MNEAKDSNTHKEIYFLRKRGLFKKCRLEKSIKVQPKKILKQVEDESARRLEHSLPGSIID